MAVEQEQAQHHERDAGARARRPDRAADAWTRRPDRAAAGQQQAAAGAADSDARKPVRQTRRGGSRARGGKIWAAALVAALAGVGLAPQQAAAVGAAGCGSFYQDKTCREDCGICSQPCCALEWEIGLCCGRAPAPAPPCLPAPRRRAAIHRWGCPRASRRPADSGPAWCPSRLPTPRHRRAALLSTPCRRDSQPAHGPRLQRHRERRCGGAERLDPRPARQK